MVRGPVHRCLDPAHALVNVHDLRLRKPQMLADCFVRHPIFAHGKDGSALLISHPAIAEGGVISSKMRFAVPNIVGMQNRLKVLGAVVCAYAVFVVYFVAGGYRSMESLVNKAMDRAMRGAATNKQVATQVSVFRHRRDKHALLSEYALRIYLGLCSQFAQGGQFVKVGRAGKVLPSFHGGKLYHNGNWPGPSV